MPAIATDGRGRRIAIVAALALGQAGAAALAAFATRDVFGALHEGSALPSASLALIALAGLLLAACRMGERIVAEGLGQHYTAAVRASLLTHLSRCPAQEVARRRSGGLALRFVGDLAAIRNWVAIGLARLMSACVVLPAAVAVVFMLDPLLGACVAACVLAGLLAMWRTGRRLGPAHDRLRSRRARLAADMSERVAQAPQLRLIGRMDAEIARLARRTARLTDAAIQRTKYAAVLRAIPDVCAGLAAAGLLFIVAQRGLPAATAAGALAALGLGIQPMRNLATAWDHHRAWVSAQRKCLGLLQTPTLKARGRASDAQIGMQPPTVRLEHIALDHGARFDVRAQPGERIALVGTHASGKTRLLELIAGLRSPAHGRVRLDDFAPGALTLAQRRRTIGFVSPRSPLLAGSLRRALTMGLKSRPADEAIVDAAQRFGLQPLLSRLGGLDGSVAENGRNLSSGELRRLLLARGFLAAPRLLLLDDLDAALGPDAPALIDRLTGTLGATTLVATQDLAVARDMDTIWFIDDGCVVETGPAEALIHGKGPTARFFAPSLSASA